MSRVAIRSGLVRSHKQAQILFFIIAALCLFNSAVLVMFGMTVGKI